MTDRIRSTRAYDLGAQCRRAGMSLERMLNYYAHERDRIEYGPEDMRKGWLWQDAEFSLAAPRANA